MKYPFILIALAVILSATNQNNSGNARAQRIQGVQVFIYSEPVQNYKVIESGKVAVTLSGSCNEAVNQAVKKAAKLEADGVIFYLESSKWDAIKFMD